MKTPKCPDKFSVKFGIELIKYLGGDPLIIENNWCWRDFAKNYPEFREKAESYFASAKTGNPALAAYLMCKNCGSNREWAETIISSAKTGDPAGAAYWMCRDCGSRKEWAESVMLAAKTGDPAWAKTINTSLEPKTLEKL